MTKFVSVIGNGESRRGFDITPLKSVTTMVGCNALFRDHNLEYVVACDRHMCQEAANTVGKNTTIYTRDKWYKQFAFWPNVKCVPELPYQGDKRQDEPFHWGTGQFAALGWHEFQTQGNIPSGHGPVWVRRSQKPENVNNIYKGSTGYTYIKRPVDPSYWIHQFNKLFEHSDCRWIVVN